MTRMAASISVALLLTAGSAASAQTTMTAGRSSAVLTPGQCNEVWSKAVTKDDTPAQADAVGYIVSFAQVDDIAQVDLNDDGTVDKKEFAAACGKGLVHAPARVKK